MTTLLSQVKTGVTPRPHKILLYGQHGVGKSTWATKAPEPIFIQTEDGLNELDCAKFPLATNFVKVTEALSELYENDHGYKTVVIDTIDWLERLIWSLVCSEKNCKNIEDIGYAKGYMFAVTHWKTVMDWLGALTTKKNMTVILLAHAHIERFNDPETDPYDRYTPCIHKHAARIVCEWCDDILFSTHKVFTKETDVGFDKTRTRGIGSGERIVYTEGRPSHIAKTRLRKMSEDNPNGIPAELPLDWETFARYLPVIERVSNGES